MFGKIKLFFTVYTLLAVNAYAIFMVIENGWPFMAVLWLYWLQSLVIGLFAALKILNYSAEPGNLPKGEAEKEKNDPKGFRKHWAGLFLLVYVAAHAVYGALIGVPVLSWIPLESPISTDMLVSSAVFSSILFAAMLFFGHHLVSYVFFLVKKEKRSLAGMFIFPYARILPMHAIIFLSMPFVAGGGIQAIVLFLGLKTIADLAMHYVEHSRKK